MFNNVVLNVFIGLVFIFLLYSLLATILQEILARWFNLRSRMLQKGIRRMLEDSTKYSEVTFCNAIISSGLALVRFFYPGFQSASNFTGAFFEFPSIKYLGESGWHSKPAYISANNFSTTLIYLLTGNYHDDTVSRINLIREALFSTGKFQLLNKPPGSIDPETLNHLQKIFIDSRNDIDRFRALLEDWFKDTMNATNGWYKNQSRLMLFFIGLFLAGIFNVDTLAIYRQLANDKSARESMVQLAIASTPKYADLSKQLSDNPIVYTTVLQTDTTQNARKDTVIITKISSISDSSLENAKQVVMSDIDKAESIVALGWPVKDSCKVCDSLKQILQQTNPSDSSQIKYLKEKIKNYNSLYNCADNPYQLKKYIWLGWLLTALAISLGATFWFDLLSKIISLRSAGRKPVDSDSGTTGNPAPTSTSGAGTSPTNRVG